MTIVALFRITALTIMFGISSKYIYSVQNDSELELDYSGTTTMLNSGQRIVDDSLSAASGISINDICDKIQDDYANITRLDLSNNFIMDEGAKRVGMLAVNHLPRLQSLDLSFNKLTETAMTHFVALLEKDIFQYLVIVGNNGAASLDGIRALTTEMGKRSPLRGRSLENTSRLLSKVIWIPEQWLEGLEKKASLPITTINSHKNYYNNYKNTEIPKIEGDS